MKIGTQNQAFFPENILEKFRYIKEMGFDGFEIDGKLLRWPGNEHCMVLSGFDLNNETVTVCDPLREVETYDFDSFERHFKQMDKMAVVIK